MADEPALEDRVESLETGQGKILSKLDELLGTGSKAHAEAEAHEERHLDRPSTIEEQVRQELAKADAERKAADKEAAKDAEHETLKEKVARLVEQKPAAPQPRRQRVMWGPR